MRPVNEVKDSEIGHFKGPHCWCIIKYNKCAMVFNQDKF